MCTWHPSSLGCRKDVHQPRVVAALLKDLPNPIFLPKALPDEVLDLEPVGFGDCLGIRYDLSLHRLEHPR